MGKSLRNILIIIILIYTGSCKNLPIGQKVKEGYVEFNITYLENTTDNILTSHMPDKMVMKFRPNVFVNQIDGFFGFFQLINVVDTRKSTNTTMLKVLDKRYYYPGSPDEKPCCFDTMDDMVIEYLDETKDICGFECNKALISFPGNDSPSFVVYYTGDILVNDPNITNPFSEIDGVLLEFEIRLRNLRMHLEAFNVVEKRMPEKDFGIPSGFLRISKDDMEQVVTKLLN